MTWASDPTLLLAPSGARTRHEFPQSPTGGTAFVDPGELRAELARAETRGLLPVALPAPGPAGRGRLALLFEASIEEALTRRGACAPGIGSSASLDESLSDQLYRSRLIELSGMVLALPSLEGIVSLSGALDPEDSAVLRWWLGVPRERPVWLLVDRANTSLLVYGPPRALYSWIGAAPEAANAVAATREPIPALSPEVASSAATMELSEHPPAVVEQDGALSFQSPLEEEGEPTSESPSPIGDLAEAVLETLSAPTPEAAEVAEAPRAVAAAEAAPAPTAQVSLPAHEAAPSHEEPAADVAPEPSHEEPVAAPTPTLDVPPLYPKAKEEWPGWVRDLANTRGPRPLAVIERTFVTSYVPLLGAVKQGIADATAERALELWAKNFAQSYREAFDALRVRGKRPAMVLDAPDIALRTARLHGARNVQLLLIDGLRFDLGLRVEQRVRALMGQKAALAERLLLWAALPSTTEVQLELIGRGASGLSEQATDCDSEILVARGRAAATPRRVKTGHRDLFKLDLVEARLSDPGPREPERLDALADETAVAVADFLGKQPPRTLVLAFGDHGFCLDSRDHGTSPARSGGASPEEVLVPALAWLVGGLH